MLYDKVLNKDANGYRTTGVYDADVAQWMQKVQNYGMNSAGLWVPQKLADNGEVLTQLTGSSLQEQLTQADAVANVITFTENILAIEIYHEEATWQDFIVNGITLKIPSGGYRTPIGGTTAKTVTIPAGVNCLVGRLN